MTVNFVTFSLNSTRFSYILSGILFKCIINNINCSDMLLCIYFINLSTLILTPSVYGNNMLKNSGETVSWALVTTVSKDSQSSPIKAPNRIPEVQSIYMKSENNNNLKKIYQAIPKSTMQITTHHPGAIKSRAADIEGDVEKRDNDRHLHDLGADINKTHNDVRNKEVHVDPVDASKNNTMRSKQDSDISNGRFFEEADEHDNEATKLKRAKKYKYKIKRKHYKKFLLPLLLAYKLKFFTLVPLLLGGLVLLAGSTGLAGFFFALFAAVMGLKMGVGGEHS